MIKAEDVERLGKLMRETLERSRLALYHAVPSGCWATGPNTGDATADLVDCPGCAALNGIEALLDGGGAAQFHAAALEGAKVPGLVADNAALLAIIRRLHYRSGAGCDICDAMDGKRPGAALLAEHEAKVSALQAQVSALTAERDEDRGELAETRGDLVAMRNERDELVSRVEGLETEVATLTAQLDDANTAGSDLTGRLAESLAERDALRAKLARVRAHATRLLLMARWHRWEGNKSRMEWARMYEVVERERDALRAQVERQSSACQPIATWAAAALRLDGTDDKGADHVVLEALASGERLTVGHLRSFLAALSAPPAETTLQSNLARDPRFQCAVHTDCFGDSEYCTKGK